MFASKTKLAAGLLTVTLCGGIWHFVQAAAPAQAAGDPAEKAKAKGKAVAAQVRAKLNERIDFPGLDPSTPLKDALDYISSQHDVTIIIDEKAFEAIGVQKVGEQAAQLPKLTNVRLGTVLRLLLGQVRGDVHSGAYLVKPDGILVTTTQEVLEEVLGPEAKPTDVLGKQPGKDVPVIEAPLPSPQIINVDVQQRPLHEALREVAEREGINILVDARAGDKGKLPVTATLNNVLPGTAVRLLADMADLKVVVVNNVFYVTTKENARELEQEQQKRKAAKEPMP